MSENVDLKAIQELERRRLAHFTEDSALGLNQVAIRTIAMLYAAVATQPALATPIPSEVTTGEPEPIAWTVEWSRPGSNDTTLAGSIYCTEKGARQAYVEEDSKGWRSTVVPLYRRTSPPGGDGEGGWRPIESAPKDGTSFLAACEIINTMTKQSWWVMVVLWCDDETGELDSDCDPGFALDDCSHWMPLPAAPTPEQPPLASRSTVDEEPK